MGLDTSGATEGNAMDTTTAPKARPVTGRPSCEAWVELVPWTDGVRWEGRCNLPATVHVPKVSVEGMAYCSHYCADHAPIGGAS